jgi:hypothetical protein
MNLLRGRRPMFACVLVALAACTPCRADDQPVHIEVRDGGTAVDVKGLSADALDVLAHVDWTPDQWTALLAVYVEPADGSDAAQRPPVLGAYRVADGALRFTPRFPLSRGVHYCAMLRPDRTPGGQKGQNAIVKSLYLPKPARAEATAVERVYPTTDRLPENQLKFYLHFTAPMSRGEAYERIHLLDPDGKPVEYAFLELGEELWDPAGKRFTLFIDPGRIKRGLKPREDLGPVLEQGKTYTLVIDSDWKDADGEPLKDAFKKTFRAAAADEKPPDPKTWRLESPPAGGKAPLVVVFPKPMDHALLQHMLWVMDAGGRKVAGDVSVTDAETRWLLTPQEQWMAGAYRLVADARLEDLAGNTIGRPFEVGVAHPTAPEIKAETVETPFEVRPASK